MKGHRLFFRVVVIAIGLIASNNISVGQGYVYFANNLAAAGYDGRVFGTDCVTPLQGSAYTAQLYAGPAGAAVATLVPVGGTTTFRDIPAQAGYWHQIEVMVPFVAPREVATVQARVWATAAGTFENAVATGQAFGASKLLDITLDVFDPTRTSGSLLLGIEPFCLIPEPKSSILAGIGMFALFVRWSGRGSVRSAEK